MSITQVINNTEVTCVFFKKFIAKLQAERPNFRDNHVFILDGASCHRAENTRRYLINLNIKVLLLGPYSYSVAPIELLWA